MDARTHYLASLCLLGSLCAWLSGCTDPLPSSVPHVGEDLPKAGDQFDATTAGTVRGRVVWQGAVPNIKPFHAPASPFLEQAIGKWRDWPNPHGPEIDPETRGVRNAVVFLRGLDPRRARPWDLPPVSVEQKDYQFRVRQGDVLGKTGFVQRGDSVSMVSRQEVFHSLHADGAAFFTLAFADSDQKAARRFSRNGIVELTSAAGYFWMRGYLFVDDHPYYTRTDEQGRFTLSQVPPGPCEVVCWLPNWNELSHERDLETARYVRMKFCRPLELTRSLRREANVTQDITFTISAGQFAKAKD